VGRHGRCAGSENDGNEHHHSEAIWSAGITSSALPIERKL
jgi:hypothetical protein